MSRGGGGGGGGGVPFSVGTVNWLTGEVSVVLVRFKIHCITGPTESFFMLVRSETCKYHK